MYDYKEEKRKILTDSGQKEFLKVRDQANKCMEFIAKELELK